MYNSPTKVSVVYAGHVKYCPYGEKLNIASCWNGYIPLVSKKLLAAVPNRPRVFIR
jgi:hypothetical protein